MPISKRRKKKGKAVNPSRGTIRVDPDKESAVSLQDLINVLAYQEYVKDGTIKPAEEARPLTTIVSHEALTSDAKYKGLHFADDAKIHMPDSVPVYSGEGENKVQIGEANAIPGDPDHVSVHLDPGHAHLLESPVTDFSIDKEHDE